MNRRYRVEGRWPFPLDMLRRDRAAGATAADEALIRRMSGEFADPELGLARVEIDLVMAASDRWSMPLWQRWESFGWTVTGVPEIDEERHIRAAIARREEIRKRALAKLTDDERAALGLEEAR